MVSKKIVEKIRPCPLTKFIINIQKSFFSKKYPKNSSDQNCQTKKKSFKSLNTTFIGH